MTDDMSMFKKMKERITDEVNSATNKLQNIQLIDQLSSSIGQQSKNDSTPNQLLPEPQETLNQTSRDDHFNLLDGHFLDDYNEEDELNSEVSPQHQLFNENTIMRLTPTNIETSHLIKGDFQTKSLKAITKSTTTTEPKYVIYCKETSSDIEDNLEDPLDSKNIDENLDVEIDLLSDKPVQIDDVRSENGSSERVTRQISLYRTRYKNVVHAFRKMQIDLESQKNKLEADSKDLKKQVSALKLELVELKQQQTHMTKNEHPSSISTLDSERSSASPQQNHRSSNSKVKDLERLLAKCKDSLKLKNSQIKLLKESLSEVEKFKESNEELKQELSDLRAAHETWTVSIAENKRVMHQEIEFKNSELDNLRGEIADQQVRLNDGHNKIRQLKSAIQDLESRLVSTSAAHQKERESLTKELTLTKNSAIRQLQKEHELHLERITLDLEKSIEALKLEVLNKDEQIIRTTEQHQQLQESNSKLNRELEHAIRKSVEQDEALADCKTRLDETSKESSRLLDKVAELEKLCTERGNLEEENRMLKEDVKTLKEELKIVKLELEAKSTFVERTEKPCDECESLAKQIKDDKEKFQQELHELNTRLNLMTTANNDQEDEIKALKEERCTLKQTYEVLKLEFDELLNKNESLARVIRENEIDMQNHQEQLDNLVSIEQELEASKKENLILSDNISRIRTELSERSAEMNQAKLNSNSLTDQLLKLKRNLENTHKTFEDTQKEKSVLSQENVKLKTQTKKLNEELVIRILNAMKNLETPTTSPGSDKSFETYQSEAEGSDDKQPPNVVTLMERLTSLASDRSNAHLIASQKLQAVLLENSMFDEEVKRLREELKDLNREKTLETQYSIEEAEKLRTENQALILDQQAYDERINHLEKQVDDLTRQVIEKRIDNENLVPDSTQFEYLKNIVFQFMLGKEPLVLARVISAVFNFDKNQVEQICRVQEALLTTNRTSS